MIEYSQNYLELPKSSFVCFLLFSLILNNKGEVKPETYYWPLKQNGGERWGERGYLVAVASDQITEYKHAGWQVHRPESFLRRLIVLTQRRAGGRYQAGRKTKKEMLQVEN